MLYKDWLRSYEKARDAKRMRTAIYYKGEHALMDALMARSYFPASIDDYKGQALADAAPVKWLVATPLEDPNTGCGWVCFEYGRSPEFDPRLILHYAYTKLVFRRYGIARALITPLLIKPMAGERPVVTVTHTTLTCESALDGCGLRPDYNFEFNPYAGYNLHA